MFNVNAISAYFFFKDNIDDPNVELSKDEENALRMAAQTFVDACTELLEVLSSQTFDNELDAQTPFYDVGKKYYGTDKKELLSFFARVYLILFERKFGPRFGVFVLLLGQDAFIKMFRDRLTNPFSFPHF